MYRTEDVFRIIEALFEYPWYENYLRPKLVIKVAGGRDGWEGGWEWGGCGGKGFGGGERKRLDLGLGTRSSLQLI